MPNPVRPRYPSDLNDQQWHRLEPSIPAMAQTGRHRKTSLRDVANAINYRWETGCAWRMLPHDFPHWGTVYAYFRTWQRTGVIREFRDLMIQRPPRPPRQYQPPSDAGFTSPQHSHPTDDRE